MLGILVTSNLVSGAGIVLTDKPDMLSYSHVSSKELLTPSNR